VNYSLSADGLYNLKEENRQLRKTHLDVHMQLQDSRVSHNALIVHLSMASFIVYVCVFG